VFGATLVQAVAWIAGTAVGVTIGVEIPAPEDFGFDTIFPACYLALLWPELRGAQDRLAALLGAGIALAILAGRAGQVAAAIRRKATCAGLNPHARKGADPCANYLSNKRPYLDYPTALQQGWPITTGVIEGACRHLVKDRMDLRAPAGDWTVPRPSSSCGPYAATATSRTTRWQHESLQKSRSPLNSRTARRSETRS